MQIEKFTPVTVRETGKRLQVWNHMNDLNVICIDPDAKDWNAQLYTLEELYVSRKRKED
jgi:hypothetical protein